MKARNCFIFIIGITASLGYGGSYFLFSNFVFSNEINDNLQTKNIAQVNDDAIFYKVQDVDLGEHHSGALTTSDGVYTWGDQNHGKLGNGKNDYNYVAEPKEIKIGTQKHFWQIAVGQNHSAITNAFNTYTWGNNKSGQLGNGEQGVSVSTPKRILPYNTHINFTQLSLGRNYSMAIGVHPSTQVWTWGSGEDGKLGNGESYGDVLTPQVIDFPTKQKDDEIVQIDAGNEYAGALTESGEVYTWGKQEYGRLGTPNSHNELKPRKIKIYYPWENDDEYITQISMGYDHSAAISNYGNFYSWGRNDYGQLGNGRKQNPQITPRNYVNPNNPTNTYEKVSVGDKYTLVLDSHGVVWSFGNDDNERLGNGPAENDSTTWQRLYFSDNYNNNHKIKTIQTGARHSAAISESGQLFTWGSAANGKLGNGPDTNVDISIPEKIYFPNERYYHYYCYETSIRYEGHKYSKSGIEFSTLLKVGREDRNTKDLYLNNDLEIYIEIRQGIYNR